MKYFISLFFVFALAVMAKSQTVWAPEGAVWYYNYNSLNSTGYIKIEYVGDTVINYKECKILEKRRYTYSVTYDTTYLGREYTYVDSNIVYCFRFGTFYTLYDFNSVKGNTWEIAGTEPTSSYYPCDSVDRVTVDSSGSVSINGFELKQLFINYSDTNKWLLFGKIIERIGAESYMFPDNNCYYDAGEGHSLRCYYDNEFGYYNVTSQECNFITGIDRLNKSYLNKIYPSFTSANELTILSNNPFKEFKIYDINGRLVVQKEILKTKQFNVDISSFDNGMYFVLFNGTVHKFVIKR